MRSMNEIVIAVKEQQPVTDEELRLTVVGLAAIQTFLTGNIRDLAKSVLDGKPSARLRASSALAEDEIRFKSMKMPVNDFLGEENTPGTEANKKLVAMCKNIFKKATGQDL